MSDLIVISNRVPPPESGEGNQGGLAVGLLNALKSGNGLWMGWGGEIVEEGEPEPPAAEYSFGGVDFATYPLSRDDYDSYYTGFSNEVLWPLFHYRVDKMAYDRRKRSGYFRVNRMFAERISKRITKQARVWVHDYHLIALGTYLRKLAPDVPIGFFLHTPFPPWQVLRVLPDYEELLEAFTGYDLIGMQTDGDRDNLVQALRHGLGAEMEGDRVRYGDRCVDIRTFPISIDVEEVAALAASGRESLPSRRLSRSLLERPMIIGVDRLDYSKGIHQRFAAFERTLELYPHHRDKVTYMQIAPPSRVDVDEYVELRADLEGVAGHINGRFSEFDWTPLRYLNRGYSREVIMGFMRQARVGLVTPLRDGMNLVAKEFVASQAEQDPGVLIISHLAGATAELGDGALVCNPNDIDGMAEMIHRALTMPLAERQERWRQMMDTLRGYDIHRWGNDFMHALERLPSANDES